MSKIRESGRQPTTLEGISMVTADIVKWWGKVGIKLKHPDTINKMIGKLIKDYIGLTKRKDRYGKKEKEKREKYLKCIANTLWVVTKETEERLKKIHKSKMYSGLKIP